MLGSDIANHSLATFAFLTSSNYPLAHIFLLLLYLVPVSWPTAYIWAMALGQVVVAIFIARLLFYISGWQTAVLGILIWSLTPIQINNHFEDGTLVQLLSLAPLLYFFECLWRRRYNLAITLLILLSFVHPITGAIVLLSCCIAWPTLVRLQISEKKESRFIIQVGILCAVLLVIVAISIFFRDFLHLIPFDHQKVGLPNMVHSFIGPFILLAPIGLAMLLSRFKKNPTFCVVLVSFAFIVLLGTFNNLLGVGLWTYRFLPYAIVVVCLTAAPALAYAVFHTFSAKSLRVIFLSLLFLAFGTAAWNDNAHIYAAYESPSRYLRISTNEQAGMAWIKAHTAPNSTIITTAEVRHVEWTPILTDRNWLNLHDRTQFIANLVTTRTNGDTATLENLNTIPHVYLLVLKKAEKVPEEIKHQPLVFPIVLENSDVAIFLLPNKLDTYYAL